MITAGHCDPRWEATEDERRRAQGILLRYYEHHNTAEAAQYFRIPPQYVLSAKNRYKKSNGKDDCPGAIIRDILRKREK